MFAEIGIQACGVCRALPRGSVRLQTYGARGAAVVLRQVGHDRVDQLSGVGQLGGSAERVSSWNRARGESFGAQGDVCI